MELLTWPQLVHRVGGRKVARRLLAEGGWWRVVRGAYASGDVMDGPATRAAALRLVLPSYVAASHRTALWLLGLDVLGPCLEVTVPRGRHLRDRPGLVVSSAALPDDELVLVDGALAVSAARAFVDVARDDSLIEAVALGDCVLRSGAATADQLLPALDRAGGLRGIRAAREVVPHLEPRSESLMESRLRMRLVLGGVPRPEAQWDVYTDDGHVGRGDLHLDGVVLEYDGREQRLSPVAFTAERRRQTGIADTALELRRFTAADYYRRPAAAVCAEVMRAVRMAAGRDRSGLRTGPDTLRAPRLTPLPTLAEVRAAQRPRGLTGRPGPARPGRPRPPAIFPSCPCDTRPGPYEGKIGEELARGPRARGPRAEGPGPGPGDWPGPGQASSSVTPTLPRVALL